MILKINDTLSLELTDDQLVVFNVMACKYWDRTHEYRIIPGWLKQNIETGEMELIDTSKVPEEIQVMHFRQYLYGTAYKKVYDTDTNPLRAGTDQQTTGI